MFFCYGLGFLCGIICPQPISSKYPSYKESHCTKHSDEDNTPTFHGLDEVKKGKQRVLGPLYCTQNEMICQKNPLKEKVLAVSRKLVDRYYALVTTIGSSCSIVSNLKVVVYVPSASILAAKLKHFLSTWR